MKKLVIIAVLVLLGTTAHVQERISDPSKIVSSWISVNELTASTWPDVQERIDLTTPVARPSIGAYTLSRLTLDWTSAEIEIRLRATAPDCVLTSEPSPACVKTHYYNGSAATALMLQLNTANLTSNSLRKRILQKLIDDGVLVGSVQ